eukprot:366083-Chlamydomonas_euryale.AAC.13
MATQCAPSALLDLPCFPTATVTVPACKCVCGTARATVLRRAPCGVWRFVSARGHVGTHLTGCMWAHVLCGHTNDRFCAALGWTGWVGRRLVTGGVGC